jgi:hypothetical protein
MQNEWEQDVPENYCDGDQNKLMKLNICHNGNKIFRPRYDYLSGVKGLMGREAR